MTFQASRLSGFNLLTTVGGFTALNPKPFYIMRKTHNGCGRPVLVSCKPPYETFPDSGMMIIIPHVSGFGAATYFRDEPRLSHKVFCDEYDGVHCGYQYDDFVQADDATLIQHLADLKIAPVFGRLALELIKECPLES